MILEELNKSDTIFLNDVLDFSNESSRIVYCSSEIGVPLNVGGFGSSCGSVNDVFEAVRILKELRIHNLIVLVSVDCSNVHSIVVEEREAKSRQNLAEHLGTDFKVSVAVEILEEALCIESVLPHKLHKFVSNTLHICSLSVSCLRPAIDDISSSLTNIGIDGFFKTFLSEDFINSVTKFSPFNVVASFWCFEGSAKLLELRLRNWDFSHVKTNSELSSSNEARSKPIKVSEEFSNSDSLLHASLSDAGKNIIYIVGSIANNLSFTNASLCLREVIEAVVEVSANSEQLHLTVNVISKVNVVYFIYVSHIHVASEKFLQLIWRRRDFQQIQYSQELDFSHMTILCDIEVLEDWFQVDALVLNSRPIFLQEAFNVSHLIWI